MEGIRLVPVKREDVPNMDRKYTDRRAETEGLELLTVEQLPARGDSGPYKFRNVYERTVAEFYNNEVPIQVLVDPESSEPHRDAGWAKAVQVSMCEAAKVLRLPVRARLRGDAVYLVRTDLDEKGRPSHELRGDKPA